METPKKKTQHMHCALQSGHNGSHRVQMRGWDILQCTPNKGKRNRQSEDPNSDHTNEVRRHEYRHAQVATTPFLEFVHE